jgi:hypothetical protein
VAELTKEEQNAINSLKRLAKRWPESLELFSQSGTLQVRRAGWNYVKSQWSEELEEEYIICSIYGITNDGGDCMVGEI